MSAQLSPTKKTINTNMEALRANSYPGRGIVMGINTLGDLAIQVYWVMGRSEDSRNRRLAVEEDVVSTVPHDPTKVANPSLTIYNAMRRTGSYHIVTNGKQTDSVAEALERVPNIETAEHALRTWTYEPDKNTTPRISGVLAASSLLAYTFSIIKSAPEMGTYPDHHFRRGMLDPEEAGVGYCIHTYRGDGKPLPSFEGIPYPVELGEGVDDTAEMYWDTLNADNRVAVVAKGIDIASGEVSYRIINALEASS